MDWRVIGVGFASCTGFTLGWIEFGTLGGAVVSAVLVSVCLIASVTIDKYVYGW